MLPGRSDRADRLGDGRQSGVARRGERDEPRIVALYEDPEIGRGHVAAEVRYRPAVLAEEMVETDETDHVVLAGSTGQDRQRADPAVGSGGRSDPLKGPQEGLAGQMLLCDTPLAVLPALADDSHRVRDQAVVDLGARGVRQGVFDGPCREIVVAVGQKAGQKLGAVRPRDALVVRCGIDRRKGRGTELIVHPRTLPSRPVGRGYHEAMYLDSLEFLEEERDAWRPFEALADLIDAQLELAVPDAHGWTGRELMGHLLAWQGIVLQIATELAVDETSPTIARVDADWEARGGDVVNAEIDAAWAAIPLDELRERFRTQPGELRGYLTVVPESRWLKHAEHLRTISSETTAHYEDHASDLDAVLAAVGR